MRLEAVSVCVNYADILNVVAPYNLAVLDRWLIVTSEEDEETREVCRKFSIETLISNDHKRDGAEFAKGRLVEAGLRQLSTDCWHLHMDADIVLPRMTRRILESAHLDESKIYGCDRIMVKSWDGWQKLLSSKWLDMHADYHCRINFPAGFDVGTRWANPGTGYVPIGFFQLAHADSIEYRGFRQRGYSVRHNDACRSDVQYGLKWDRRQRELLAELIVAHLESEPAKLGANWNGRTTRRFEPSKVAPIEAKPVDPPPSCGRLS